MSICGDSFNKKTAQFQSERAAEDNIPMTNMSQYKLMLGKLRIDIRRLKSIKATDKKVEVKRDQLLPDYKDYIDGVLEANSGKQDDVLMYNMVWLIDTEDYTKALQIAHYAIEHELKMPERFNRDVPDLVIEYICNTLLKGDADAQMKKAKQHEEILQALYELSKDHDIHDAVTVKLYKALGLAIKETKPEQALELLQKVYELDKRGGVANIIKALKKQLGVKADANPSTAESS